MAVKGDFVQGDVYMQLVKAAETSKDLHVATPRNPVVLAEGEVTGHRHAFYSGAVMFRDDGLARPHFVPGLEALYAGHVTVTEADALLEHGVSQGLQGDHGPIPADKQTYIGRRQMEFPLRESKRMVAD